MKILIVEDDKTIAEQLCDYLREAGFVVHVENDGEVGHYEGEAGQYDAILLDLGLPTMDGVSILEKWRKAKITTPVLIITARTSKMEVIRGLEQGADDYITKPFDMEEVAARIRSTIRRARGQGATQAVYKNVTYDMRSGRVFVNGVPAKLTRTEFLIVQYLFINQGKLVPLNELIDHTYEDFDNDSSIIARHVANIRKKIGHEIIMTETNRGYYVPKEPGGE
ncbi:MAG: response regulator transcription factor [Alphaproteobacteria bacterium]|nr:response regulator transcription factor [Alphaproteobacteria bacterium]